MPGQSADGTVTFYVVTTTGDSTHVQESGQPVRVDPTFAWTLAVAPLLFALSVVLINVETPRFRAPVEPFLVLLAACALAPSSLAELCGLD